MRMPNTPESDAGSLYRFTDPGEEGSRGVTRGRGDGRKGEAGFITF